MHTRREVLFAAAVASSAAACSALPKSAPGDRHVVLLGDSILDNGRYVPGEPAVIEQLAAHLAQHGKATLLARDGDVTRDIAEQLGKLPATATHLVVSVGGNDALGQRGLLQKDVQNAAEVFGALATIHAAFLAEYDRMLATVLACGKPTTVCTIYDSNFDAPQKPLADVALSVFNDVILRCAGHHGVPVLDLRRVFQSPADYANPIEPSAVGGAKLVQALGKLLDRHDFAARTAALYA